MPRCHRLPRALGFSLLELAIALVILGLVLGGLLRAHELIVGARVRDLMAQQDTFKAAYFGFQERFRALPGDFARAITYLPGTSHNGNGNGLIEDDGLIDESILAWEHLARAGFIQRSFSYAVPESSATSPATIYGGFQRFVWDRRYGDPALIMPTRHNLKLGPRVPTHVAAEMDNKIDDGRPYQGHFQFSTFQGNAPAAPNTADCIQPALPPKPAAWRSFGGSGNCGAVSLL